MVLHNCNRVKKSKYMYVFLFHAAGGVGAGGAGGGQPTPVSPGPQSVMYVAIIAIQIDTIHAIMLNITNPKAILSFDCMSAFFPANSADRDYIK